MSDDDVLQKRAQSIFARASRAQTLQGKALSSVLSRSPIIDSDQQPGGSTGDMVRDVELGIRESFVMAGAQLHAAGQIGSQLSATDTEIARLTALINGEVPAEPAGKVQSSASADSKIIDVEAVEVKPDDPAKSTP